MLSQIEAETYDLQDVRFVNDDSAVLVWDVYLESKMLIYSLATGNLLTKFQPETVGLGIKRVSVSPDDKKIATGMFDTSIVLYNNTTAEEIASLSHLFKIDLGQSSAKVLFVYQEEVSKERRGNLPLSH
mmetsp:Transcript_1486/g.1974  ORF Transcript_1486/g.1974 Transcript_1486/m.1974 type:complete len:129 (-) Transcript_1486:514-900(-)